MPWALWAYRHDQVYRTVAYICPWAVVHDNSESNVSAISSLGPNTFTCLTWVSRPFWWLDNIPIWSTSPDTNSWLHKLQQVWVFKHLLFCTLSCCYTKTRIRTIPEAVGPNSSHLISSGESLSTLVAHAHHLSEGPSYHSTLYLYTRPLFVEYTTRPSCNLSVALCEIPLFSAETVG